MMRKLLMLGLLVAGIVPAQAQYTSTARGVQQAIKHVTENGAEDQIQQIVRQPSREISWADFEQETAHMSQVATQTAKRDFDDACILFDSNPQEFENANGTCTYTQGVPDYTTATKGYKYIFLASQYKDKRGLSEAIGLIHDIHGNAPRNTKILLATEFAARDYADDSPLHIANSKEGNLHTLPSYNKLTSLSANLEIDVLGLDDELSTTQELYSTVWRTQTLPAIKDLREMRIQIGDATLVIPDWRHDKHVRAIVTQYQESMAQELDNLNQWDDDYIAYDFATHMSNNKKVQAQYKQWRKGKKKLPSISLVDLYEMLRTDTEEYLNDYLARSSWGAAQRFKQWARYIKQLSPYYDIIIIYGGNENIAEHYYEIPSIVDLLEQPYALFDFVSDKPISKRTQRFLDTALQIQQNTHANAEPDLSSIYAQRPDVIAHVEKKAEADLAQIDATRTFFTKTVVKGESQKPSVVFKVYLQKR